MTFKICTHCTPAHRKPIAMNRRKCPVCKAGSYLLRPATADEVQAQKAKSARSEAFIQSLLGNEIGAAA